MVRVAIALSVVLAAGTAAAQSQALVGWKDGASVVVWKDDKALREGFAMIRAGVGQSNPSLLSPLISCIVPSGTKAVFVESPRMGVSTVTVIDGPSSACRGAVTSEELK